MVRLLRRAGHAVRCAATDHALQFVTRVTLETVSGAPLYNDLFASGGTEHISLREWADIVVVAPATANCIAKLASGIADDALSTLLVATDPHHVLLAPAMNSGMWRHPATERNVAILRSWGVSVVGPESGALACGTDGIGRMADPAAIVSAIDGIGCGVLSSHRWLVTAGPTYEKIDSVRFIGNYSSGKMGFALAEALAEAGADVDLVTGHTSLPTPSSPRIHRVDVESAREMLAAVEAVWGECHGAILSAAVADYRPAEQADHKIKKQGDEGLTLQLVQNPDILATLGRSKREGQTLVGFALETDNEEANAAAKLRKKNLDFIVLNSLRDAGAGFGVDTNKVTILGAKGGRWESGLMTKREVAQTIVRVIMKAEV